MEETQRDSWSHAIYSNRPTEGEFNNLFPNLKKEGKKFYGDFRTNLETFDCILEKKKCSEGEKHSNFRFCVSPV
jgi:hypothetical protein